MKKQILMILPLLLSACSPQEGEGNAVYASFYPIYDLAKRITKGKMEVHNLTPYGAEPHDYEPTVREVMKMVKSKAILLNGFGMEGYASSLPKEIEEKTHVVTEGISTLEINGVTDPHVWLSLRNGVSMMKNILSVVQEIDPANASFYQSNYEEQAELFLETQKKIEARFKDISHPYLVVSHAAFGYLCQDLGLTQIYVSGLSPNQEPTPKKLQEIMETMERYQVSTIFYEELAPKDIAEMIAKQTGAKIDNLNALEGLSAEEEKTEDYLSVMKANCEKIWEACR